MELYPILECRNKLNDGLWYVISPTSSVQISGGVGSKACAKEGDVYVTCGAQPDQSFGAVYHFSLDSFKLRRLPSEFAPRYEHAATLHKSELFVFGGAEMGGNRNDIQALDIGRGELVTSEGEKEVSCPVSPRTIHNPGTTEGRLWVWGGGENGADPVSDTHLHSLTLETREWESWLSSGEVPCPRHGHVVACTPDKIFVHGGMSGAEVYGDLYSADLPSLGDTSVVWRRVETGARQPVARAAHSSAVHGKYVYVFGGFTGESALDDLWRLDTEVGLWVEVTVSEPRPHPRLDQTICVARLPYSDNPGASEGSDTGTGAPDKAADPPTIQDITGLLHEAAERGEEAEGEVELPAVSGYQDVLVLFGGMDTQGNIFNDMYAIKL